jgi:xanthine/uracil permease
MVFVRASLNMRREENQLDVTECFIALMIRSACFGHFYAHHQELETIRVLLPPMVCSAWLLVIGGQVQAAGCASRKRDAARPQSCNIPLPGLTASCSAPDP